MMVLTEFRVESRLEKEDYLRGYRREMIRIIARPSGIGRQSFLSYTALSMHKIFLLVVCLALFAGASLAQTTVPASANPPDAALLIGTWDGRTPDGMGATISFHDDSSMTFSPSVMIDFITKPQGDELVATVASPGAPPQSVRIRAEGDRLTYKASNAPPEYWARLGKAVAGQPPYAGKWAIDQSVPPAVDKKKKSKKADYTISEMAEARNSMRMVITPEGKARLRIPMRIDFGAYNVQGNKLLMQYGGKVWVATFRFDDGTLYLLRRGEAEEVAFERTQ